ncbi:hypothetical protein HRR83_000152 [Exophiala dermatitidis]|uniref:F-box domain-containing protein n=1 Tax=Exophiala dermatitidis (strain ATCC 34100 / CBS 525.76 / NIH/UT8656) TaxID=858893 RepID=H6C8G6_EXODN|nr:uncharacterized protein HMPREF1120_08357 [Exophiala dermatitidis NIH/UT8656]KAJ4523506.1 hypothetical protein HRR73_002688 [Exophiala dermatitidis]EHY60393.1 hypothetical protein HMPREF1120_08357 [Exophiala dermatitidis NIH/UT8656]KAJ4527400.1 hypothetical protein HRR74_000153 [Exophiala dermatitidis]KAJ4558133.1 hypothetical protein HRR77_000154 [Exophiala dermatitidis]KAJ4581837.1 hypothetical protein HRR79_000842 [Exophiala dermatitidis]
MEGTLPPQPCRLLDLPNELKLHIVDYIHDMRDLYNLSRTCSVLEHKVMKRLYHSVDCHFPRLSHSRKSGSRPFRAPVTQSVRHLTVRYGMVDRTLPSSASRVDSGDMYNPDDFIYEILQDIPTGRLTSFAFLYQTPLGARLLDQLIQRHDSTLQHLRFCEPGAWEKSSLVPTNLTSLECRTVHDGDSIERIIMTNKKTLQKLQLGQEKQLIEQYHQRRGGHMEQVNQPKDTFFTAALALKDFKNLRELSLHALDVSRLRPGSMQEGSFFCNLERMTLESCPGSAEFLDLLANAFHWTLHSSEAPQNPRVPPKLKHFLFRHENPTAAVKDSIVRFLGSFNGLNTLSLLFDNGAILERPSTFIERHGPTLRTLVLEARTQPREHLSMDTSRPFGAGGYSQELWVESINDIARFCPNLVELGMGFPWNDELVRLRKTALPTLQHLRTIHIRNFPENHVCSQLGDYSIKEYANKFIEWVFPDLVGGCQPSLEQLAIGPTVYQSRWKMKPSSTSTALGRQPPQFLSTHHFCLDWAQTRFGRWTPLVTPVSEKFMEELAGTRPLGGVFEQVWLR